MNIISIGCGSMGKRHIANILEINPAANIHIIRKTPIHDKFTQSVDACLLRDWSELQNKMDLAIIANPSEFHLPHLAKVIELGIPVYIEKPLVTSISDLHLLQHLLKQANYCKPIMMGCNLRFLPSIIQLKSQLEQGVIGNICRAIFEVGYYLPYWRPEQDYQKSYSANKTMGGGVIFDLVHELDLVRYLLGEFSVQSSLFQTLSHLKIDVEDTAVIHLGRSGGPFVSVHLDYVSQSLTRNIKIVGDEGTLIWDLVACTLELRKANHTLSLSAKEEDYNISSTYKVAMKQLITAINNNTSTTQNLTEAIRTTELMLACKSNNISDRE